MTSNEKYQSHLDTQFYTRKRRLSNFSWFALGMCAGICGLALWAVLT